MSMQPAAAKWTENLGWLVLLRGGSPALCPSHSVAAEWEQLSAVVLGAPLSLQVRLMSSYYLVSRNPFVPVRPSVYPEPQSHWWHWWGTECVAVETLET